MPEASPHAAGSAAQPAARPAATKAHDLSGLLLDTELDMPTELAVLLQTEVSSRVTAQSPPDRLRDAADSYRRIAAWLQGLDGDLAERGAEIVRSAEAIDERLAEARGHLRAVGEGVQIEQVEWLQHRIPAQQQDVLRAWWPTDSAQSEYLAHEDVVFAPPDGRAKRHRALVSEARRVQFGHELLVSLYQLVVHDLCGTDRTKRQGNEYVQGKSGLSRALVRHFANDAENPFLLHAQAAQELRTTLRLPATWPAYPDAPIAMAEDVLCPESVSDQLFDANGNATGALTDADRFFGGTVRPFISAARLDQRLDALSADYRQPTLGESIGRAFRENAVYLGLIGAVAGKGGSSSPIWITLGFIVLCFVLGLMGRRKDVREAEDNAVRVLDQKLRQLATKELASVIERIVRAIRAFHSTAQSKINQDVEMQLRAIRRPYDEQRRTSPARLAAARARAAAHRSYCESMVQTVEGVLRSKAEPARK